MTDRGYLSERVLFRSRSAAQALRAWGENSRWNVVTVEPGDPDNGVPLELVWQISAEPEVLLHYVEDAFSDNSYFYLTGIDVTMLTSYAGTIAHRIPTLTVSEILQDFDKAPPGPQRARALMKLGLAAPYEHDESFFSRIRQGMESDIESDRDVAVWASSYSPYPQYLPILDRIAQSDPSAAVRRRAGMVAEAMRHAGLDES